MKEYKNFMDGVKAPDTLRQRLAELEAPEKRPIPWRRYGAMAAALALVCGLGGLGAWAARGNGLNNPVPTYPAGYQGSQPENIDIALVEPGEDVEPGQRTLGGYDVTENGMVVHYVLPYIEYGEAGNPNRYTLDWDIPQGASRRDLSQEEIVALMGGEDAVSTHLDWGEEYVLTGWGAWYEDGSFWGAYINGVRPNYGAPADTFEFAVTAGQLPPTCIAFPGQVAQEIGGVTVTANSYETSERFDEDVPVSIRQVSFLKDGYGYRFDMRSGDPELAEKMVSRLVRQAAQEGLPLSPAHFSFTVCPDCGVAYPAGEAHDHTHTCPECGEMVPEGQSHHHSCETDPACVCEVCGAEVPEGTDHSHTCATCGETVHAGDNHSHTCATCGETVHAGDNHSHTCATCGQTVHAGDNHSHTCGVCGQAVLAGANHSHTCGVCGQAVQAGANHSHTCGVCGQAVQLGANHSHTCATCGQTVNAGDHHSHGVCGLPLAPDTQTCPNCGVTYTTGTGHTCRQGGHHHGGHH